MRYSIKTLALGAALIAAPAFAQINVGLGGQAGGNAGVGVDTGSTIGAVSGTVDRTVGAVDRTVNRTADSALGSSLALATSADLTAGATVRDGSGRKIGTVQSVHGDMAVVTKGSKSLHVPIASLYRSSTGLVTKLSKTQLKAAAEAQANANVQASN
jgi:hypothetical protein